MKYTLGIDLHKYTSTWVLIDEDRHVFLQETVKVLPDHITKMIDALPVPAAEIQAGMEPVCGWRWVRTQLAASSMDVHIANPLKLALIGKSVKKNDKTDAQTLAELLRSGFFPESYCANEEIQALRVLVRARAHLVALRTSAKNRLHGLCTAQGVHTIPGGNPLRKAGRAYLVAQGDPVSAAAYGTIDDLDARIAALQAAIEDACAPFAGDLARIMSMPGIGMLTAATVIAESGDIRRFQSGRHFAAYAGLVPRERSSGGIVRFGATTKAGPKLLRSALVEAAMRIREQNAPELYAFVAHLAPKTGAKKARVALARKLTNIIYAIVTKKCPYDPALLARTSTTTVSDLAASPAL